MDDLNLAVASKGLRVRRQASGVPAVVTRELAGQVRRRVVREGAQPLGTVGTIELHSARNHRGGLKGRA
eukprot:358618-Chlamydomonas_euryale.AAC.4